jgi:hypothetical protein
VSPPVYALLSAPGSNTSAIVADRIYKGRAPQGATKPYVVWQVVGGHAEGYVSGRPGMDEFRVQLNAWSKDQDEAETLAAALVADLELDGYQDGVPVDVYEEATKLFGQMVEFYFWTPRS